LAVRLSTAAAPPRTTFHAGLGPLVLLFGEAAGIILLQWLAPRCSFVQAN